MTKLTQNERLLILEEQMKELKRSLNDGFGESKKYHGELIAKLDTAIAHNARVNVEIATLKEKVATNTKIIWTALGAGISGFVLALWEILRNRV